MVRAALGVVLVVAGAAWGASAAPPGPADGILGALPWMAGSGGPWPGAAWPGGWRPGEAPGAAGSGPAPALLPKSAAEALVPVLWTRQVHLGAVDVAYDVAVGGDGSVVASGHTGGFGDGRMLLVKYDPSGNPLWTRTLFLNGRDFGYGVAVDPAGRIAVAGLTIVTAGGPMQWLPFVATYTPDGALQWARTFPMGGVAYAIEADFDSSGNILVAGLAQTPTGVVALVLKLDAEGQVLLQVQRGAPRTNHYGWSVAAAPSGRFVLAGVREDVVTATRDGFAVQYDASGNVVWTHAVDTSPFEAIYDVAVDALGVSLGGVAFDPVTFDPDVVVVRLNPQGRAVWTSVLPSIHPFANGVATDALGDTFVAAPRPFPGGPTALLKFGGTGQLLWALEGPTGTGAAFHAVAVDGLGNPVVAGTTGLGDRDVLVRSYRDLSPDVPAVPCRLVVVPAFSAGCSL